jgi:hypothetical protein
MFGANFWRRLSSLARIPPGEFRRKTPFEAAASAAAAIFEPIRRAAQGMDVARILSRHALTPVLGF